MNDLTQTVSYQSSVKKSQIDEDYHQVYMHMPSGAFENHDLDMVITKRTSSFQHNTKLEAKVYNI